MKMCLVVSKKGHLRFSGPVYQRRIHRGMIKLALIGSAISVALSLFMVFDGESKTEWWAWVSFLMVGIASTLAWLIAFFPLPLESEKAERRLASCLTSDHLDRIEAVFKDAVSSRLGELAKTVVYPQRNDPTRDHSQKQEFRQLFDAAKTLQLIGPGATYGDFFNSPNCS